MGPIEKDLDEQISFLQRPQTRWVTGNPVAINEACAVMRVIEHNGVAVDETMARTTSDFLCSFIPSDFKFIGSLHMHRFIQWNDCQESVEPVLQQLEKARARAAELGV